MCCWNICSGANGHSGSRRGRGFLALRSEYKWRIGEVILRQDLCVGKIIHAVSAAGLADMRTVHAGSEGNHVLVDHSAEEGIATCEVRSAL